MSLLGGVIGSVLGSNQNPFNSGFGSFTGGLFPAGINQLGDNFLNGYINYYYANKLADKQNQRQIDFWNMQNAYNTPKAQMERYAEAGLNPNLIYSQGNTAGPIGQAAVGSFNMPNTGVRTHFFDAVQALSAKYAIENMKEQNLNLRAQNALIDSQTSVADANAQKQLLENAYFIQHGQWPSSEAWLARNARSLVNYMPELWSIIMREVPGTFENRAYNRLKERRG